MTSSCKWPIEQPLSNTSTFTRQCPENRKMKMQLLAVALLFCLLPTAHCLFGVDVAIETEPNDFCDEGPPGKYCLLDLSGWHDCHVDRTTGKMVDTIYSCAPNTRCACFYGPACPGSLANPCQPYRLPPPPPDNFTLEYNSKQHTCSPMGCRDTYSSGREIQSLTEEKKRDDVYDIYWSSVFVQRGNGSSYIQSNVRWDLKTCKSEEIKAFPETAIPSFFSYNGTVRLGYRMCEQWIWRTGGHNVGQGTSLTAYYITNQTNAKEHYPEVRGAYDGPYVPVMVEFFGNSGYPGKTSSHNVINITSFANGEADEKLLELPSFCKT